MMLMVIMLPSSSLRGFVTEMAAWGGVVERARREVLRVAVLWSGRRAEMGDFPDDCHEGARKSRNSGCCAWVFEVVKVRVEAAGAHARGAFFVAESARRHFVEAVIVVGMVRVVCMDWCS